MHHTVTKTAAVMLLLLSSAAVCAATSVLTRSYDNGRTGANLSETQLTPQRVAIKGLRRVKSLKIPDDDRVEAQPLYVHGLVMQKDHRRHNVVFVASMGNHVFAFDADAPEGQDLLWQSTLLGTPFTPRIIQPGDAQHHRQTSVDLFGINILWGILSTPVIDLDTGQMYVVNWTQGNNRQVMQLHHLRLSDGQEIGSGQLLTGAAKDTNGALMMDARGKPVRLNSDQKQRAALLLSPLRGTHKTLFVGVTGGETPGDPHGWMVAVDVDTFKETAAIATTLKGFGGGIWQGSQGPASDDQGNVYVMTGNGGFNARKGQQDTNPGTIGDFNGASDFAEAFIRFKYERQGAGKGTLTLDDWFIPFQDSKRSPPNGDLDYQDQDLGSAGPVLPQASQLVLGAGKDGILYVLDRLTLGKKVGDLSALKQPPLFVTFNGLGLQPFPPNIDFPLGGAEPSQGPPKKTHHLHASPAYWVGPTGALLFDWGENETLRAWTVDPNTGAVGFRAKSAEIASRALATNTTSMGGMTGGMISVSSNGKNAGIIWGLAPIDDNANKKVVEGIARAYDATALDSAPNGDGTQRLKLLWDSKKAGVTFNFSKFCPPVVADGKLYVATYDGRVDVYAPNN
jgi:outer membrane protein assembly factor BamB